MKKTTLKYSSLLALLSVPFFSTQTLAAECATGSAPAAGCTIDVDNITYTQTGDISPASGTSGIAFTSGADSNTLNLTGGISTTGNLASGILLNQSDNNTINVTGNISTAGTGSDGLLFESSLNNTTTITGNIDTTNDEASGLHFKNINVPGVPFPISGGGGYRPPPKHITTITGNISTTGAGASGLYLENNNINIPGYNPNVPFPISGVLPPINHFTTITGNISTTGAGATGLLFMQSTYNTTTITGNISTTGSSASGLLFGDRTDELSASNNTTTITGNISTTGSSAYGLHFNNAYANTTTITGNISTLGTGSDGLLFNITEFNTTTITGNISTIGNGSNGLLFLQSTSNTTTITGNITTSGTGGSSEPIRFTNSDSNTITLSGAARSLGGDQAILLDTNSRFNTFIFKQGASFIGGLENNGGTTNKLIFDMGKASSYNLDTDGTTWTLEDTSKPIVSGSAKSMGVADIDNQAHILYRRMDPVNDVLSERQRLYTEGQRPTGYYMDSYYGHDKRDEDQSEISGNAGGVTVGYVLENTETPMEVLVNFEVSQDNYGAGLAKQTTESNSLLAGLFLPAIAEDVMGGNLSAKVLVGMSDNDAKRTVLNNNLGTSTASEKVSGDYTSSYISAGAEWLTEFLKVERVTHELSVGADLVQAYNEDYTAGEYKVDSRDMTQIQSRVLYGMTYKNLAKTVDVNTRFGVSNQYMVAGDKQDYKINETSVSYTGDDNSFYYTAALGAKYYLADNTNLYVDTKYGQSSDDIQNLTVDFGFISRF